MVLTTELYYKAVRDRLSLLGPPELRSEGFISEEFVTGLKLPTKMTFIGDDILILEKIGSVRHVTSNGTLIPEPILELDVATVAESGLIGIISKDVFVYLYYTEPEGEEKTPKANKVVKYRWTGSNLVDPVLIKELPASEKGFHNGGAMTIGKDGTVYLVIGDIVTSKTILQNFAGEDPNDTGVILPVDPPGDYYGIGIRNSYGLVTDPITGNIWETENGPRSFDEINLVPFGFNSGWKKFMGPSHLAHLGELPEFNVEDLPEIEGYEYSEPEFSWERTADATPTGIAFPTSELFEKYQDSLFVGTCNFGSIFKFQLNSERTGFVFQNPSLQDLVYNPGDNNEELVIGQKFGCITDLQFGPDGYLYVVSLTRGAIFKLSPEP